MKLSQTTEMAAAEPLMAIGALVGVFVFFGTGGWIQSKFGWYWSHAMVTAPFFLFWLVGAWAHCFFSPMKAVGCAFVVMIPFVVLWIVRFNIPVTTEWWERL